MTLETATYINQLNSSYPEGGADRSTADDHLRLIKSTVLATFPAVTGPVTVTHTELNLVTGATKTLASVSALTVKYSLSISAAAADIARISQTVSVLWAKVTSISALNTQYSLSISAINASISALTTSLNSVSVVLQAAVASVSAVLNTDLHSVSAVVTASLRSVSAVVQASLSSVSAALQTNINAVSNTVSVMAVNLAAISNSVSAMSSKMTGPTTLTASFITFTLGNGNFVGRWTQSGNIVQLDAYIELGNTSTLFSTAGFDLKLPTPDDKVARVAVGTGYILDASANTSRAVFFRVSPTANFLDNFRVVDGSSTISTAGPWTWSISDQVYMSITYQVLD